ncbi:glycoside hydrolase family 53 protein [Natronoflexus pectinivorans]|uniref:Arabinogalactan endo-beta-1,4-galactanase n=1 Tax=Natronoflexus pectinivorans TaxID=682526 RepID=A0A4R2GG23_9BACT|nr:glycosyl hydrolase 53 family protein [Natronoflexus pectinivorans]TCO07203.1 arabinogalactan endo-1,4-beta-galactosidase [Natronoflexus pectinivorans]
MRNAGIFVMVIFGVLSMVLSQACSDDKEKLVDVIDDENDNSSKQFMMGVDLSYVNQIEDNGGVYLENGIATDPYEVLKNHGANYVRLRLWHNPDWVFDLYDNNPPLYSGFYDVMKSIQRAKDAGMSVLLDFHYSDTWADPGHQDVPKAWQDITSIDVLSDSVYNYTYHILDRLHSKGLLPEMIQVGNETNCGMMFTNAKPEFPSLNVCQGNWSQFGQVINSAIKAIRDIDSRVGQETIVALHVADPATMQWWLPDVIQKGGIMDFDVMGFSYYHIWHTSISFNQIPGVVEDLINRFNKDIVLLETAYPFTTANNDNYPNIFYTQNVVSGFPYTVEGQKNFMISLVQNLKNAGAIGAFYWEPAWITSDMRDLWGTGSSWENCAFFNFSGNLTEVVEYFSYEYE